MYSQGTRAVDTTVVPWSPWVGIGSPTVRGVLGFLAFWLAYMVAYRSGLAFSPAVSAPFWFPDSVLLCALLSTRTRHWWWLLLAILPIRLIYGMPPGSSYGFLASSYVNDCAKAVVGALLLRRFMSDPIRLNSMRDLGVYCVIAVLLIPALSAFGGAAARSEFGFTFWSTYEQWFLGDAMTHLIVTPFLFYWVLRPPNPASFSPPRIIEAGALAIGLLLSMSVAFETAPHGRDLAEARFYAPVPFMVWAAIRFRMFGATAAVAFLSLVTINAAIERTGSFAGLSSAEASYHLQYFLLLRVAPLYLAALLIEQWVRLNNSLHESEQRFRNIANQAPMMTWTSGQNAGCEFASQQWLQFTGRTLVQTLGSGWSETLHPDDRQRTFEAYAQQFSKRRPLELEYRARRYDGEYRWMHIRGMPRQAANGEFLGYVGSAIDVTEQREYELALKRSEARYRDVVESQTSFVCRFLPDGTLTFVNSTFCRFLDRPRMQLLGENFIELLPTAARTAVREAVARATANCGQAAWECEVAHVDGNRRWQSWVCHFIDGVADETREIQAIGYDTTDRKRADESGRQLAHAARFAALGELTAMVAHEINQPLCAILSNAEAAEIMLRSAEPPLEELRQILADIRNDDLRADAAIRGIRSLLNRRDFQPQPMDLTETIEHVLRLIAGDVMYRRVSMRREIAADLPQVTGDRSHLEQVLVILIVNGMDAMKDTPEGSRDIVVGARRVDETTVETTVRDFGHGIPPATLPQLFESFFTTKSDGMGLGLSIARSMIAAHGGRIWAENATDGGAVFRFTLRVVAPGSQPPEELGRS